MSDSFEQYRPLLFSIAYRMLGSAMEAEDIVQEAYLRYQRASRSDIRDLQAYLSAIVTRLCLDYLKSARVQRETYIGPWLPEPVLTGKDDQSTVDPASSVSRSESISMAFLVLLEKLTPLERAVFLLREVFDYEYAEIARIVDRSEDACRQYFSRARKHLTANRPRFDTTPEQQRAMIDHFIGAVEGGDMDGLMNLLAEEVTSWADGGGKVTAARRPVRGRELVARFLLGIRRFATPDMVTSVEEINGLPALVTRQAGKVMLVMTFELEDGLIKAIRSVLNPDKLTYLNTETTSETDTQRKEGQS